MQIDKTLGIVGVLYVGEYDSLKHYEYLNCVTHNGSSYVCVNPNGVIGVEPTAASSDWQLSSQKGDTGEKGEKGDKPVSGVDYNTDEEKEAFKNEVVNTATKEVKENISQIEEEAIQKYNNNASEKTTEYDNNASAKLNDYNDNADEQLENFNNNSTNKINDFNSNATQKVNDFNTNYDEKIADINEASASIDNERIISDKKYARAIKAEVEDVQQTQIFAENDEVDDLVIKGVELTQETREGYNQLNLEKYNYSENQSVLNGGTVSIENGILKIDATNATANMTIKSRSIAAGNRDILAPGTYYFGVNTNGYYESAEDTLVQFTEGIVNITENYFISQWYTSCKMGETVNKKLLLSNNSSKTDYEQYGVSPSLNYPSEVKVSDEQNIQISKNNLFNVDNINTLNNATIENKIITSSALNAYSWFKINTDLKLLKIGEVYVSCDVKVLSGTVSQISRIRFNDNLENQIDLTKIENNITSEYKRIKFKTEINEAYDLKNLWIQIPAATSAVLEVKNLMISYYDVDYEDYYSVKDINISLENSAIEGYFDVIDRENKIQKKVVQEFVLTGDEEWQMTYGAGLFNLGKFTNTNVSETDKKAISNYFKFNNINSNMYASLKDNEFAIQRYLTSNNLFIKCLQFETVEDFKAKLKELYDAGTPVKIYYTVESPTEISLSEEVQQELDKFKLYDDLNNVSIDEGSLSFKYNKSLLRAFEEAKKENEDLTTRVATLESQVLNLLGGN